jgi:hypothetical protein
MRSVTTKIATLPARQGLVVPRDDGLLNNPTISLRYRKRKSPRADSEFRGRGKQELHHICSISGTADVVLQLGDRRVVAECKGGPLVKREGSPQYRILKEVLGQILIWNALPSDLLVVAVPDTPRFRKIACDWQQRPLVMKTGIQIALGVSDRRRLRYRRLRLTYLRDNSLMQASLVRISGERLGRAKPAVPLDAKTTRTPHGREF